MSAEGAEGLSERGPDIAGIVYYIWADNEPPEVALEECHAAGAAHITLADVRHAYDQLEKRVRPVIDDLRQKFEKGQGSD